mmetsp:Transcript_18655/g.31217  ORF Transcript_18655/g.31217 Transcript_18655/m.31217 type:complete len:102 (-) Transcript_18655:1035-1340(-)
MVGESGTDHSGDVSHDVRTGFVTVAPKSFPLGIRSNKDQSHVMEACSHLLLNVGPEDIVVALAPSKRASPKVSGKWPGLSSKKIQEVNSEAHPKVQTGHSF